MSVQLSRRASAINFGDLIIKQAATRQKRREQKEAVMNLKPIASDRSLKGKQLTRELSGGSGSMSPAVASTPTPTSARGSISGTLNPASLTRATSTDKLPKDKEEAKLKILAAKEKVIQAQKEIVAENVAKRKEKEAREAVRARREKEWQEMPVIYFSSTSGNTQVTLWSLVLCAWIANSSSFSAQQKKNFDKIRFLLSAKRIKFRTVDIALAANIQEQYFCFSESDGRKDLPHIFVNGLYRGVSFPPPPL